MVSCFWIIDTRIAINRKESVEDINMSIGKQPLTLESDESIALSKTIEISASEFKTFKLFLGLIRLYFNDFCLVDGAFRSFSNDRTLILEVGFPFFKGINLKIADITNFFKLVSTFNKKSKITLKLNTELFTIEDDLTSLSFVQPRDEYLDNNFIPYKEMEISIFSGMDLENLVFRGALSKLLISRTKKWSRKIPNLSIQLQSQNTNQKHAHIVIPIESDQSDQTVECSNRLNSFSRNHLAGDLNFNLPTFPFKFDQDILHINCFPNNDQTATTVFNTKVNNLFVNMYWKSELPQRSLQSS